MQLWVIVVTDPTKSHTHRQDRLQYTAPQLARSVIINPCSCYMAPLQKFRHPCTLCRTDGIHQLDHRSCALNGYSIRFSWWELNLSETFTEGKQVHIKSNLSNISGIIIALVHTDCLESCQGYIYYKKLSWCWQSRATLLEVSQGHQTWYHSIC